MRVVLGVELNPTVWDDDSDSNGGRDDESDLSDPSMRKGEGGGWGVVTAYLILQRRWETTKLQLSEVQEG